MHASICSFALHSLSVAIASLLLPASLAFAAAVPVVIEPDDYADSQNLSNVSPFVTLSAAVPPTNAPTFDVLATSDSTGASTGTKVFSHAGVPFWSTDRIFRMDFHPFATSVSLDYIASGFFSNLYAGRLEAYSSTGVLLASDNTAPLAGGRFETMSVAAPQIAYALAYPPADPFGDLDHLTFTSVPEPAGVALCAGGVLAAVAFTTRQRCTNRTDFAFCTPPPTLN